MEIPIQRQIGQTGQVNDKELINRIKNSDGKELSISQNIFYKRYSGYVYKVASLKCRNFSNPEQLAKEITQETFIVAFSQLQTFNFKTDTPENEYQHVLKGWLGRIANIRFLKIYTKYLDEITEETDLRSRDETICPMCGEFLVEERKMLICPKKHYKTDKGRVIPGEAGVDSVYTIDLFKSLYETSEVEVPNEFRTKLQEAMNTLTEKQRHILLTYANEGCLDSKKHLSTSSLQELCKAYNTVPDTIKHIKSRAYNKILSICTPAKN